MDNICFSSFCHIIGILERGLQIDGLGMKSYLTYDSNVLFALRFMIDCNIVGGNWMEVPVGKYKMAAKNLSSSQLEFDCLYPFSQLNLLFCVSNFALTYVHLLPSSLCLFS